MKKQIIVEIDDKLMDGELLLYKNGVIKSVEVHELLPELEKLAELKSIREDLDNALEAIRELRGED